MSVRVRRQRGGVVVEDTDSGQRETILAPFVIEGDPAAAPEAPDEDVIVATPDAIRAGMSDPDVAAEGRARRAEYDARKAARLAEESRREAATFGAHAFDTLAAGLGANAAAVLPGSITGVQGDTYSERRDAIDRDLDIIARENPRSATAGQVTGGIVQGLVVPMPSIPAGARPMRRIATSAGIGAGLGAVNALGHSEHTFDRDPTELAEDTIIGAAQGGASGAIVPATRLPTSRVGRVLASSAGGAAIGAMSAPDNRARGALLGALGGGVLGGGIEAVDALSNPAALRASADSLDEASAPLRTRSAGARTVGFQRLVEDLPGGHQEAARVLAESGVAPRGSMLLTTDDAALRAREAAAQAGRDIGHVRDAMAELGDDAAGLPALAGRRAGFIDNEAVAQAYDDLAARYDLIPEAENQAAAARYMAERTRSMGPDVPFESAQQRKQYLDRVTNWRDPNPGNRLSPLVNDRRDIRRAVAGAQDAAVAEDLGGEALDFYRGARRRFQVNSLFDDMAHDSRLRDDANRLASPSDTAAGLAGAFGEGGNMLKGIGAFLANRILRGREHSLAAGTMERTADALRWVAEHQPEQLGAILSLARVSPERAAALASELAVNHEPAQPLSQALDIAPAAPINPYADLEDEEDSINPYADLE